MDAYNQAHHLIGISGTKLQTLVYVFSSLCAIIGIPDILAAILVREAVVGYLCFNAIFSCLVY